MSTTIAFDVIAKDRASDTFDRVGDSATRSTGKLKKFAAVGAVAVAAGAVVAGKALIGMAQAAIEDDKAQQVLATSMKNAAGANRQQISAVEDWISAQGKAKGIADDDLRPAMSRLVQATGDVGRSQKLAGLAMDVSAGTGKSLKSVTDALAKAQTGSLGGLSKMGVATKNADGSTKSLKQVTEELAKVHGGQSAKAADTAAGKMDRLRVMWDEAKESLGARLLPMIESGADKLMMFVGQMESGEGAGGKFRDMLNLAGDALQTAGGFITGTVVPGFKQLVGVVKENRDVLIAVAAGIATAKVALMAYTAYVKVVTAVTAAWNVVQKLLNGTMKANPLGIVITVIGLLAAGMVLAYKKSETFRNIVDKAFSVVKDAGVALWEGGLKPAFGKLKDGFEAVGKAGTWLWNKALQPAFKFIIGGVASILDMWSKMLDGLSKVPGFGWAAKAADAMANAADKARGVADGLSKIKSKTVVVTVAYKYTGRKGGVGSTRSDDPNDPSSYLGRMAQTAKPMAQQVMEAIADGIEAGGKKLDKVLIASRDRIKEKLAQIRDDMTSMSQSVASALNNVDFGGTLEEHLASLTGTNGALTNLMAVFQNLKDGASKGYLSSLMQSGNIGLATALANDPTALANASSLYDQNTAMANTLGDQTAQAVLGDQIEAALEREIGKLIKELKDAPEKQANKIRKALEGLRLELTGQGKSAGQGAHLKGAW